MTFQDCFKIVTITGLSLLQSLRTCYKEVSCISSALFTAIITHGYHDLNVDLLRQSYAACSAIVGNDSYDQGRIARRVNGEIIPESESDDAGAYLDISDPLSESGKALIVKKQKAIRRRWKRRQEKAVAEQHFLKRKGSRKASKNIERVFQHWTNIEAFVEAHQVGADAWRRTGVLTFNGNTKIKKLHMKKFVCIFRRNAIILFHMESSFSSVCQQLCVPRNRQSSKRYQSVAMVTSRRVRKRFNLEFNPDEHWSGAFYKGLNELQYADGTDMVNTR